LFSIWQVPQHATRTATARASARWCCFRLLDRLPEGRVLDEKQIEALPYELG